MSRTNVSAVRRVQQVIVVLALLALASFAAAAPGSSSSALPYPGSNAAKLAGGTSGVAKGGDGPREPSLGIVTPTGDTVVELEKRGGGYSADLIVRNDGAKPLEISGAVIRGETFDVRAPENLEVRVGESSPGSLIVLPAGELRHVVMTWAPGHTERIQSFYAQLMITSNDPTAHVRSVGLHVQVETPFSFVTAHPIPWLLLLPLFGAAFAIYVQLSKKTNDTAAEASEDDRMARHVTLGASAAQVAVAIWTCFAFDPDLSRLDGNDGLQFAERGVLLHGAGIESFFAIDGLNLAPLLVVALAGLFAVLALRGRPSLQALALLLSSLATGVFASFDVVVFLAFVALTGAAAALLLARAGVASPRVRIFAVSWGAAVVVLALVVWTLRAHTDPNFSIDGSATAHTSSIPELARAAFATKHAVALGAPLMKVATIGLVLGFALLLPFGPLASATAFAFAEAPSGVALSIAGSTFGIGGYGLLRLLGSVLPEGTRWAAPTLAAIGAFGLLYGCVAARGEADDTRRSMTLAAALSSAVLVGLGALTPEGVRGAMLATVASPLAAMVVVAASSSSGSSRFVRTLARLAAAGAIGPALWSVLLVAIGVFATSPLASIASFLALTVAVAIAARTAVVPVRSAPSATSATSGMSASRSETGSAWALAGALLVLTVWPTPLFVAQGTAARRLLEVLDPPGPDQIARRDEDAAKFS